MKRCAHFIGIGGIGMSGMARIFKEQGCEVSGSDQNITTPLCKELSRLGITLYQGNKRENIPSHTDMVIYSAAITPENQEFQRAKERGIPCFRYSQMLGKLMTGKKSIAVAGTHGKTTTTGLLTSVLKSAGENPGYLVGGEMADWGGNGSWGKGRYFVAEACEFHRSFHDLFPQHAILTNIEKEHLDYYKDLEEIQESFRHFLKKLPTGALVAYPADCPNSREVVKKLSLHSISFGIGRESGADIFAANIRYLRGGTQFDVYYKGQFEGTLLTRLLGEHNAKNILAVYGIARGFRLSFDAISEGISQFKGVARRFDLIGEERGITILDDYAHHPTEIKAVLSAIGQRYPKKRLFLVFQPHQYSRTYNLLGEFAMVLAEADRVILPEIYAARDRDEIKSKVSSLKLCKEINRMGGKAQFIANLDEISSYLLGHCKSGDLVVTMGAGNVNQVAYSLLNYLRPAEKKSA